MKVLCIVGMPGAGKSLVSEAARILGIPIISMGDVVREEAIKRGLSPTRRNLALIAEELRRLEGPDAIAKRCVKKVIQLKQDVILVEGVRSPFEVALFRRLGEVIVIAVHTSPGVRYRRLVRRGRSDDPRSWDDFVRRDLQELGFGIACVILDADVVLVNENKSAKEFREEAIDVLRRLLENAD
ncbi:MAG: dephospho-CoA kinase [Thermoprotei archaeon]|nr:MAG: dephospho-CoA kinase [Thermoprotei archaeon]RLF24842.1 MAG: dephospho-CoA kinase [Thermoprotei archaeon]